MEKPFAYAAGGFALVGALVATLASFAAPGSWQAVESVEIPAPVASVFSLVESAEGWTRWLGWRETDDPTLSWTILGPTEATWSGERLGKGVLMVLPGDNGWAFSMTPEQGLAWHGSILVSTATPAAGEEASSVSGRAASAASRVEWTVGGDFSERPWLRLFGQEAADLARGRMRTSLDRLARIAQRNAAREADKIRIAAEDAALAAEIAAQHLVAGEPVNEHTPDADGGADTEAVGGVTTPPED